MSALSAEVAEVAEKVMGWKVNRSEHGWHTVGVTPKRLIGPSKCRLPGDLWDPYTDPRAMMEVKAKLVADGFFIEVDTTDKGSTATIYTQHAQYHELAVVTAPTEMEAVCRAAIRAKEGE